MSQTKAQLLDGSVVSVAFSAGSAAAPSLYFAGNTNTGIYSPGADTLAFVEGGVEAMRIDSSGRVGIGTSSPNKPLHIYTGSSDSEIRLQTNSGTEQNAYITLRNSGGKLDLYSVNGDIALNPGNNVAATFKADGKVGIGTSAPNYQLHVTTDFAVGASGFNQQLSFTNDTIQSLLLGTGYTALKLNPLGGNVGIGTTNPGFPLQIGATGSPGIAIDSANSTIHGTFGTGGDLLLRAQISSSSGGGQIRLGGSTRGDGDINAIIFSNASTERARIDSSGRLLVGTSTAQGDFTLQIQGDAASSNAAGSIYLRRGLNTAAIGSNVGADLGSIDFGANDGTIAGRIECLSDATWSSTSDTPGRLVFSTTADGTASPTERMRIQANGNILFGTTTENPGITNTVVGSSVNPGYASFSRNDTALYVSRTASDGSMVSFQQGGTEEGSISVSGTTISYNGAHLSRWSQLPSGAERTEILRGTVLSNLDEMCEWGEEDNEQLNRMQVSDVEGDKNVSGVFQDWDDDDDTYINDFYCAMTGDFIIRIAEGVTVERGDLLMSAGDGTAKPQGDGYVQDKTIAKVTSTNVSCTYPDGSYCVPCVLMAC